MESNIFHKKILSIVPESEPYEQISSLFRKRQKSGKDPELINKHLADLRESHTDQDETLMKVVDIPLVVPEEPHENIRTLLEKHDPMWFGTFGCINVTKNSI